jgi:hypothetical protein
MKRSLQENVSRIQTLLGIPPVLVESQVITESIIGAIDDIFAKLGVRTLRAALNNDTIEILEKAGFGVVRNLEELQAAMKKMTINASHIDALMSIPSRAFRKSLMTELIVALDDSVHKLLISNRDDLSRRFLTSKLGFSDELANEMIKSAKNGEYVPKQFGSIRPKVQPKPKIDVTIPPENIQAIANLKRKYPKNLDLIEAWEKDKNLMSKPLTALVDELEGKLIALSKTMPEAKALVDKLGEIKKAGGKWRRLLLGGLKLSGPTLLAIIAIHAAIDKMDTDNSYSYQLGQTAKKYLKWAVNVFKGFFSSKELETVPTTPQSGTTASTPTDLRKQIIEMYSGCLTEQNFVPNGPNQFMIKLTIQGQTKSFPAVWEDNKLKLVLSSGKRDFTCTDIM